ncbi:MAG TPA: glycosyltransferase [Pyrinomonadaceae bacterium]|jgi:glycosyltransferase involved in cell wall biosynthesis
MRFTVAICTWNRARLLSTVLERLTRVRYTRGAWEVLVVNNNSTDGTERVLDAFAERLPLRPAFEPRLGLSHARNTAVGHARGDYVVWTDDDALVDANWLAAYDRAAARHPEAAIFGGPVRPHFEGTPPLWLSAAWEDVGAAFAARDLGSEPFEFGIGELPYGANFVIRTREQKLFAYDPALGRKGDGGALGEETAVIRAILEAGGTGWWVPDASVEHWIPKERQTIRYLRRYYALQGRTFHKWDGDGRRLFGGRPLWLWRSILRAELAYTLGRLSGDPSRWLKPLIQASLLRGATQR